MPLAPTFRVAATVFVVDADVPMRQSVQSLVRHAGLRSETFASPPDFLARPRVDAPSCLVLGVALPDADSLELQRRMAIDRPDMPVILIARYADVPMAVEAMKAGAFEFLTRPLSRDVLLTAIERAIDRSEAQLGQEAERRVLGGRLESLSRREREVMALVVSGRLNKEIGFELGISEITVKAHRGKMMRKMQAGSLADLVRMTSRLWLPSALRIERGQPSRVRALSRRRTRQPNVNEKASTPGSRTSISNTGRRSASVVG